MSAATLPHFKVNYGQVSLGKEVGIMTQDYSHLYDLLPEHNSLNPFQNERYDVFFSLGKKPSNIFSYLSNVFFSNAISMIVCVQYSERIILIFLTSVYQVHIHRTRAMICRIREKCKTLRNPVLFIFLPQITCHRTGLWHILFDILDL